MDQTTPLVITISRQLGCGGAYIGQQLAKSRNIYYADREIISKAAKQLSILEQNLESRDEKTLSFWQSFLKFSAFTPDVYTPPPMTEPTDYEVFKTEAEIIEHIAKERSSIIIGRCGSYILRGHPNHVSIFLHADIAFRTNRIHELYNVSNETARKMIVQSDKDRANYCSTFTETDWTDARLYDLSIDTGKTGINKSIDLISSYLELIK